MVNLKNHTHLCLIIFLCYSVKISALPLEQDTTTQTQLMHKEENILNRSDIKNKPGGAKLQQNTSDLSMSADANQHSRFNLSFAIKPRGFNLPKQRANSQQQNNTPQAAAQNYYNNYLPDLPPLGHAQPYYNLNDDSILSKFLSQQSKQFQPRAQQQQPFTAADASILGSGDFGILKGGTFYSDEQPAFINEEISDFYYGDASNTHAISSTEGFIQKYTYPEEQFAQFRDFADLGTPNDSAFSQFVVVYAAKNSTRATQHSRLPAKPKNIFEQLQEIDKEKALEEKKLKKHHHHSNSSVTKLKLVKTKLMEKKWVQKQPVKLMDDDPLIALS